MKHFHTLLLCLILLGFSCSNDQGSPISYADPMIGTDGIGHTFPGATTPFGMVQLSPTMNRKGWNWTSGYHYSDSIIKGFAHNHLSGTGIAGLADILLMPMSGELKVRVGDLRRPNGYKSTFSHENENASPGYYQVLLNENMVNVELTATPRVGVHKYTFMETGEGYVVIDPTHANVGRVKDAYVEFVSESVVIGYKDEIHKGTAGDRKVYFYAEFSQPFIRSGTVSKGMRNEGEKKYRGKDAKAFVGFDMAEGKSVEVKVGISYVSLEGAKANYEEEAANHNFESALSAAQALWEEKLNKIEISTSSIADKRTFYTGLYHSYISPNLISDVDGKFVVEQQVFQTDYPQYSNYSTWDTFRALHPLLTLLEEDDVASLVNSMSSRHGVSSLELPKWEMLGYDNRCMPGYSIVPVMAEAILKGISGIDVEQAYAAMKHAAFGTEKHSPNYGGYNGMKEYVNYNYIPAYVGSSVTKTTEYNYYDWCIAKVAEKLGYDKDATFFYERSKMWMHNFNPENGYLWPKDASGNWVDVDFSDWEEPNKHYVSGNIWGYSSFVPHDMATLVSLHGGGESFAGWIDDVVADTVSIGGKQHVDISGFIGKYGHGDEPSHQLPYLYNYAGQPWKTQAFVPQIMDEFYNDSPSGLVNNEDMGQMSAWYVFSALGFYPVAPGSLQYIIGTPKYEKTTINLPNGKSFTIKAGNVSNENIYIQSARLNGQAFDRNYLTHKEVFDGGTLTFEMGAEPNKSWGSSPSSLPGEPETISKLPEAKTALAPYAEEEYGFFKTSAQVSLNSGTDGANIYYTLDGSMPNKNSNKYTSSFRTSKSVQINAVAIKEGLAPSPIFTKNYIKSIFPELKEGYPEISISGGTLAKYGSSKMATLIDQVYGSTYFKDKKWVALKHGNDMVLEIDLGEIKTLNLLEIAVLSDTKERRFPPQNILVQKKSGDGFVEVKNVSLAKIQQDELKTYDHRIKLPSVKTDVLK